MTEARHRDEWGVEFSRIVAFSDGVFAIAITLLVLAIEIPENSADLTRVLEHQRGDFFAYALSFGVLGNMFGVSLTFALQIAYSYRANLVKPEMRDVERRVSAPSNFIVAGIFLASIPVAVFAPTAALLMWLLIFLTGRRVSDRLAALRA